MLIVRPDAPLFYANAQPLRDTVSQLVRSAAEPVHTVILDLDANDEIDITSSETLGKLIGELHERHVRVALAHVHATVADTIRRAGVITGEPVPDRLFPNLDSAAAWASTDSTARP